MRGHAVAVAGARLRDRVEHAYHTWRARNAAARLPQDSDPLRPLRSARHVLLREPDVAAGYKIPMAPALRKAVLRVLNHYDTHMRTVLGTLVDGMERSIEELAARQQTSGPADLAELDAVSEALDRLNERVAHLDDRLLGIDDGALRTRADLAGQIRRLAEVEDAVVGEATRRASRPRPWPTGWTGSPRHSTAPWTGWATWKPGSPTCCMNRTTGPETGLRTAVAAQQASDALRRVVLRDHERRAQDHPTSCRPTRWCCPTPACCACPPTTA